MDNNVAERAIRPIAIGRENFMFCGSHEGAKRAALIRLKFNLDEWAKLRNKVIIKRMDAYKNQTALNSKTVAPLRYDPNCPHE